MRSIGNIFNLILIIFLISAKTFYAQNDSLKLHLTVPESHRFTESLFSTAGEPLEEPFKVFVLDVFNHPVRNVLVSFQLISEPENGKGTKIESQNVLSDSLGTASTSIIIGKKPGTYIFSASIDKSIPIYLTVNARESRWVLMLVSGLIGGLGLFLFGMNMLSSGLKKTAGSKMRSILSSVTNNRFFAVGIGTLVTMIIQSSSATTVMLVSFVQANLMTFSQTLGIILGAGIGTTVTLQLIAFKITDYSLLMIGLGFLFYIFSNSKKLKSIGESILGFGILFFGMQIMSEAMGPLRTYQPFIDLLLQLKNPILGILIGTLLTAVIQSSAAFLGIVIILGSQGLITLEMAVPLIFGANIGTSITAILASLNSGRDSKRVAIAHTFFKVLAVLLFVWWIPTFTELVKYLSPALSDAANNDELIGTVIPRQIANAHTIFNIMFTVLFIPFLNQFSKLIYFIFPDKEEIEVSPYSTRFLEDSLISTPALALSLAKAEVINIADKVKIMTEKIISPFFEEKQEVLSEIKELENEIDFLQLKTSQYLTKISQQDLDTNTTEESFQILQCSAEFEQIADLISNRMRSMAKKRIKYNLQFSDQGKAELQKFHTRTVKQLARAIEVFKDFNLERGKKLEVKYQKYKAGELDLKRAHFERLRQDIPNAVQTNEMHLELIDLFLRINRHAASIGRIMMGEVESEISDDEKNHLAETIIDSE